MLTMEINRICISLFHGLSSTVVDPIKTYFVMFEVVKIGNLQIQCRGYKVTFPSSPFIQHYIDFFEINGQKGIVVTHGNEMIAATMY